MSDRDRQCAAERYREFDFWIGRWEVREPDGTLAGHNTIEPILDGCALRESWEGVSGMRGTSLNAFDARRGAWHQTWSDTSGLLLRLDGGLRAGAMVLEGDVAALDDPSTVRRHRISWSRIDGDGDRVRQLWESSSDGVAWEIVFDGRYARVG